MTILIATGLRREARLMAGPGVTVIAGGGDAARLERELDALAASATAILSSGLAGALDPALQAGDVVVGIAVASAPSLREGMKATPTLPVAAERPDPTPCLDGERFQRMLAGLMPAAPVGLIAGLEAALSDAAGKAELYRRTGALAVDMESHVAARVAARHGLPFAALRMISDAADVTLPPAAVAGMRPDGGIAIGAILASLIRDPRQMRALMRTARDAEKAFRALGRLHDMLRGFGIGRLDPGQFALDMA